MATLETFRAEVRDWSNRDMEALPDSVIDRCLEFAADTAYRDLKIPPLEANLIYTVGTTQTSPTTALILPDQSAYGLVTLQLRVPDDAVDFMFLRTIEGGNNSFSIVFNEKTDTRTFYDITADKTSENYWTRHGSNIRARGLRLSDGTQLQLHYHRRLPALDARYEVNQANLTAGRLTQVTTATPAPTGVATGTIGENMYFGNVVPNWLRDENRKVLLFGALFHCFDYLNDMEDAQKYQQKFRQAIDELNDEDRMRTASGGNTAINYTSYLI